jgi:hypothetical protein
MQHDKSKGRKSAGKWPFIKSASLYSPLPVSVSVSASVSISVYNVSDYVHVIRVIRWNKRDKIHIHMSMNTGMTRIRALSMSMSELLFMSMPMSISMSMSWSVGCSYLCSCPCYCLWPLARLFLQNSFGIFSALTFHVHTYLLIRCWLIPPVQIPC